jgi:hypothetical protein
VDEASSEDWEDESEQTEVEEDETTAAREEAKGALQRDWSTDES